MIIAFRTLQVSYRHQSLLAYIHTIVLNIFVKAIYILQAKCRNERFI